MSDGETRNEYENLASTGLETEILRYYWIVFDDVDWIKLAQYNAMSIA